MNIFVLDTCPITSAQYMCDKHIPKMIVESFQMLSTALHINGIGTDDIYKPAFQHHPCTIWAAHSGRNWAWLYWHASELLNQYTERFGRVHKCETTIMQVMRDVPLYGLPQRGLTAFAQAMPVEYKSNDPVWSYRAYYLGEKSYFAKWERGVPCPWWWHCDGIYQPPLAFT